MRLFSLSYQIAERRSRRPSSQNRTAPPTGPARAERSAQCSICVNLSAGHSRKVQAHLQPSARNLPLRLLARKALLSVKKKGNS